MNARIGLGISAALLLVFTAACGEFEPTSLRLETKGELTVGETTQLVVYGVDDEGVEEEITDGLSFSSSNEAVATVDEKGLVTVHKRGPLTITAKAKLKEGGEIEGKLAETRPICHYPEYSGELGQGEVIPPFRWMARAPSGIPVELKLEDIHCNVEWKDVDTIHLVFSAGWCGPCTDYARALSGKSDLLKQKGMQVITIEIDTTTPGQPANTDFAYDHLKKIAQPVAGFAAGDQNTMLDGADNGGMNFLRNSGFVMVFPTRTVVRTRDMRFIADASATGPWNGFALPIEAIADDPEADWSKPGSTVIPQPGEPGN